MPIIPPTSSACPPLALGKIPGSLFYIIRSWTSGILERLKVPERCRQQHLYLWIMFHNIIFFPDSSFSISIPTYISSVVAWVVDTCLKDIYIEYYSYTTTSFTINFFFLLITSSNNPQKITSRSTMGTVFPYSSCNMDLLLMPFFNRYIINNTILFITYIL